MAAFFVSGGPASGIPRPRDEARRSERDPSEWGLGWGRRWGKLGTFHI